MMPRADRDAVAARLMGEGTPLPVPDAAFSFLLALVVASVAVGGAVGWAASPGAGVVAAAAWFCTVELLTLVCSMVNQSARIKCAVGRISNAPSDEILTALTSEQFTARAREFAFNTLAIRD